MARWPAMVAVMAAQATALRTMSGAGNGLVWRGATAAAVKMQTRAFSSFGDDILSASENLPRFVSTRRGDRDERGPYERPDQRDKLKYRAGGSGERPNRAFARSERKFSRGGDMGAGGGTHRRDFVRGGAPDRRSDYDRSGSERSDSDRLGEGNHAVRKPRWDPRKWKKNEYPLPKPHVYSGDFLYGINPVLNALRFKKRHFSELLIQEDMDFHDKKDSAAGRELREIAMQRELQTRRVSKHDLNMMTDSRPHQGYVLLASKRRFEEIDELPAQSTNELVLVLDEVCDPQNFGALLRTAHFLNVSRVVVCDRNSAPLSPAVSKASAGAMECMTVYSSDNLMHFLDNCKFNNWQVIGTALGEKTLPLGELKLNKPTILVLGNEGHGVRKNILSRCDQLARIEGSSESQVDSLNVSVTGGIIMHYILSNMGQGSA